jgi:hypothetical protein
MPAPVLAASHTSGRSSYLPVVRWLVEVAVSLQPLQMLTFIFVMSVYSDGFLLHFYFWVQLRTTDRCPQKIIKQHMFSPEKDGLQSFLVRIDRDWMLQRQEKLDVLWIP